MASGQLANPFSAMSLESQASQDGMRARPRLVRIRSPPCYRCIFREADAESSYADWALHRGSASQPSSRMRLDFKELGLLGQGAFSKVFRVRHRLDGREYAIKRSLRGVRPGTPPHAQFLREAQVLAALEPHPCVVRYHGAWAEPAPESGGGGAAGPGGDACMHTYLVLERCEVSLAAHLALSGEPPRAETLAAVLRALASALAHVHAAGVAHLDVKPDNIYLCGEGPDTRYKLGDFGQAVRVARDGAAADCPEGTCCAVDEGDCRYMSAELMQGDQSDLRAADLFALGATALQMATGEEPPRGGPAYHALREGRLPLLPAVPVGIARIIKALMHPDPRERPPAAKVADMTALGGSGTTGAGSPGASGRGSASPAPAMTQQPVAAGGPQYSGLVLQRSKR